MYHHNAETQYIIDRAKDHRAEVIFGALQPAFLSIALVATLALVVARFGATDTTVETTEAATTVALVNR